MLILRKIWEYLRITLSGIVMVVTDTIPGLSGSVFLSAAGLLEPVWTKWEDILRPKQKGDRLKAILFYIAFGIGTTVGMVAFAKLIKICLNEIPAITFWFFFVVAIGGAIIYFKNHRKLLKSGVKSKKVTTSLFGAGFFFILSIILTTVLVQGRMDISILKPPKDGIIDISNTTRMVLICFAGFFSAYAMFTPGMSGGLIILMFGAFGWIFGGLLAEPQDNIIPLVIYGVFVMIGIITAILTLDKLYKKVPYIITWILFGFVVGSLLAIPIIFDVFIPSEPIRWAYISLAALVASGLIYLTLFEMGRAEKKGKQIL